MTHDVFVSYSQQDKNVADAVVGRLEGDGVRCWIAPRDIVPGTSWGEAIVEAIDSSRVMVLVLSQESNRSRQVIREVERAVAGDVIILPFRIDAVDPTGALAYFLGAEHWLDALTPPMERHIDRLVRTVKVLLAGDHVPREDLDRPPPALIHRRGPRRTPWLVAGVVAAVVGLLVTLVVLRDDDRTGAPATSTASPTTAAPTSTAPPALGLEEVGRFQPIDLDPADLRPPGPITGVDIDGDVLAYANGASGVTLIAIDDPSTLQAIATYGVDAAQDVAIDGGYVFIAAGEFDTLRLAVLATDGSGQNVPIAAGEVTSLYDVEVVGGFAYVTSHNYVGIVDATDPTAPRLVFEWTPPGSTGNPTSVAVVDGIGYFGAGWDGLYLFDLADPSRPLLLGHWASPDWIIDVAVVDEVASLTLGDSGYAALDVSDPTRPRLLGTAEVPGFASPVDVVDGHAYVGSLGDGASPGSVAVIDLRDPSAPLFMGMFGRFPAVSDLALANGHVYVSDEAEGIIALEITGMR